MKSLNIDQEMRELSVDEATVVNGGESLWYWVAYGAGSLTKDAVEYYKFCRDYPIAAVTVTSVWVNTQL